MSRLFALPRELRDIIYDYTFRNTTLTLGKPETPGLLTACEQLRREATPYFYSLTTFRLGFWAPKIPVTKQMSCLSRMPHEYLAMVQAVEYLAYSFHRVPLQRQRDRDEFRAELLRIVWWQLWRAGVALKGDVLRISLSEDEEG